MSDLQGGVRYIDTPPCEIDTIRHTHTVRVLSYLQGGPSVRIYIGGGALAGVPDRRGGVGQALMPRVRARVCVCVVVLRRWFSQVL